MFFIKPDEPVEHADAEKRGGKIFCHANEMDAGEEELPLRGARVLFTVYSDEHGLGAERCQLLEQGSNEKGADEDGEEDGEKKKVRKHKLKRTFAKKEDGKGKGKGKKDKRKAKGKGKGKKDKDDGPRGPNLARERVTKAPITGKLIAWMRVYGWVKPSEEIDDEDAKKRGGKIYIHRNDIPEGLEMKKGMQ